MPRTVDPVRREQLLAAAVDYAIDHGLADLTLRPLAEALGVLPNSLVHHFGSKDELLTAILNGVRERLRETVRGQPASDADSDPLRDAWAWSSDPEHLDFFRSFFEAYGLALRHPDRFAGFLERVVSDWLVTDNPVRTTLDLAVLRGLLLDLLTTGEHARVQEAFGVFSIARRALGQIQGQDVGRGG
jgi:AcrR family transcriptional regulator